MTDSFQFVAGNLALDFANTLDYRYDPNRTVDLLPDFDSFLRFAKQGGILTAREVQTLRKKTSRIEGQRAMGDIIELREALYFLLLSAVRKTRPSPKHLLMYNRILPKLRVPHFLCWQEGKFILSSGDYTKFSCGPLQPIVEAANSLLSSPERRHIGECSDSSCRWLFLDRSKNHSRRWCSMEICGNRSKARTFYAHIRRVS